MHLIRKLSIMLAALILCFNGLALAEVEMLDSRTLNLDARPIDMVTTADGKYTFILAEGGKIFVFDAAGNLSGTLKVSETVVSIGTNASGDYLMLADSKSNSLQVVRIGVIVDIDITGLPFKGPAAAPVVVAVFSDYQ